MLDQVFAIIMIIGVTIISLGAIVINIFDKNRKH